MIRQTLQFRQIVREYSDRVGQTARRILGDDRDAEEAVQDVFLNVYHGLKDFKGESDISTWIYRVAVNICISRRRKAPSPEVSWDDLTILKEVADPGSRPDTLYEEAEAKERVAELTARLGDKEAQAVTLFYLEELDYRRISDIMDMPIGSVATVLHRGRTHLHLLMLKERKEKTR
jgi:RNA polymerase sigma-70 factor (ECF subfamily)